MFAVSPVLSDLLHTVFRPQSPTPSAIRRLGYANTFSWVHTPGALVGQVVARNWMSKVGLGIATVCMACACACALRPIVCSSGRFGK